MDVLWATDGSTGAHAAVPFLSSLRLKRAATVQVLTVVDCPMPLTRSFCPWRGEDLLAGERHRAETVAREAAAELRLSGAHVEARTSLGDPVIEIVAAADKLDAHLVIVGATGRTGLAGLLLGSVARNLTRCCARPVLVARPLRNGLREIVIATDGSPSGRRAAHLAVRLPLPAENRLTVVHVVRPHHSLAARHTGSGDSLEMLREAQRKEGEAVLDDAESLLTNFGKTAARELHAGDPATELLRLTEDRGTDLIICGTRGVSALKGLLVGSVADRLIREAPCSVLTVH